MRGTDETDKQRLLLECANLYRAEMTESMLGMYLGTMRELSADKLRGALNAHVRDPDRGKFFPLPADILAKSGAGKNAHLTADEAWAIALESFDEAASVMWTDEIELARNAALRIWHDGDHIGARMAFKAAYDREMRNPRPVYWKLSAGHDHVRRIEAVRAAHTAGLISEDRAMRLLPGPQAHESGDAVDAREWISHIKRILADPAKIKRSQVNIDSGAWTEEMEAHFQGNLASLGINEPSRIHYTQPGSAKACAYPNCASPGTLSTTTTGGGSWYCAAHFRV